ncbi:hypothetical protein [Streptococcus pasteurianus]|nr:phage protein [Streptococcus pasteurianus]
MNELEIKILNFIKNRGSFENPVPRKRLETEFSLKKREVERAIESLRVEFKHPIVASKKAGASGYYLPKNDDERNAGLAPYKAQILTSQQNLTAITSINLKECWKGQTA